MIAFCGLNCSKCQMYEATQKDDDNLRAEAAKMLNETYNFGIKPSEINCDGCLTENGRLLGYCSTCKIRACGMEKEIENCAHCDDHKGCEKLGDFHKFSVKAKGAFENVLKSLS